MRIISCILIAVLIGIDQLTKNYAVELLRGNGDFTVIPGLLEFTYVENYGAAFGMLQNKTLFFLLLTGMAMAAFVVFLFGYKKHTPLTYAICTLILAGGLGNMIDRAMQSYVVDFIHVLFFPPVFNFADCCAVIGTGLVFVYALFFMDKEKKTVPTVNKSAEEQDELPVSEADE